MAEWYPPRCLEIASCFTRNKCSSPIIVRGLLAVLQYMWPAVRDALKKALAEDFTVEAELAWKHVFDYIVSKMAQGINSGSGSPTKTSTPKNISPLHDSGANGIPP